MGSGDIRPGTRVRPCWLYAAVDCSTGIVVSILNDVARVAWDHTDHTTPRAPWPIQWPPSELELVPPETEDLAKYYEAVTGEAP